MMLSAQLGRIRIADLIPATLEDNVRDLDRRLGTLRLLAVDPRLGTLNFLAIDLSQHDRPTRSTLDIRETSLTETQTAEDMN
jgi:hypothetical protein